MIQKRPLVTSLFILITRPPIFHPSSGWSLPTQGIGAEILTFETATCPPSDGGGFRPRSQLNLEGGGEVKVLLHALPFISPLQGEKVSP